MTRNQKLELSREIRQWIGIAVGAVGSAYLLAPEQTTKFFGNVGGKIQRVAQEIKKK